MAAAPPGDVRATLAEISATAEEHFPGEVVQFIHWADESVLFVHLAASVEAEEEIRAPAFDARTGRMLDGAPPRNDLLDWLQLLHGELLSAGAGQVVLLVVGTGFLVAIVSGVAIYSPFTRRLGFGRIRAGRHARVKWLDVHNLLGITSLGWALVVGATGVLNTLADRLFYAWREDAMERLVHSRQDEPRPTAVISPDSALSAAAHAVSRRRPFSVVYPGTPYGSPRHYLMWTEGTTPLTSRLVFPVIVDAVSGEVAEARDMPWYFRAVQLSRPLHFGDYGGLPLKLIWALLDLVLILTLSTGVYLTVARWLAQEGRADDADPPTQA